MPWTIYRASDAIVGHQLAPSSKPPQRFFNDGAVSLAVAQLHEVSIHFWICLMRFNRPLVASATAVKGARPENGLVR